jgi:hypothetical protein
MIKRPSLIDSLPVSAQAPEPTAEPPATPALPPKPKRDVQHTSIYIPRGSFERLREVAFHERKKVHDLIMEGVDRVIENRGHPERTKGERYS